MQIVGLITSISSATNLGDSSSSVRFALLQEREKFAGSIKHRQTSTQSFVYLCMITHTNVPSPGTCIIWVFKSHVTSLVNTLQDLFGVVQYWSSSPNSFIRNADNIYHPDNDAISRRLCDKNETPYKPHVSRK